MIRNIVINLVMLQVLEFMGKKLFHLNYKGTLVVGSIKLMYISLVKSLSFTKKTVKFTYKTTKNTYKSSKKLYKAISDKYNKKKYHKAIQQTRDTSNVTDMLEYAKCKVEKTKQVN